MLLVDSSGVNECIRTHIFSITYLTALPILADDSKKVMA